MIESLKSGFYTSIQDDGRMGCQEYGVPYSGVMDSYAASMANVLLGNDAHDAVLEVTMMGPSLQFNCDTWICLSGADISPVINDIPISNNKSVQVKMGDKLSFGKLRLGFRTYLAVSGGFKTETVLGSRSMFHGVTKKHIVQKGDRLPIAAPKGIYKKNAFIRVNDVYLFSKVLKVFKGPEFEKLSEKQQHNLLSQEFTISKENNRMAYQLEQPLENDLEPIITSPVIPGTVQLTPSGRLIILMRDCQTTGGYPRVLQLADMSINILAQKFTGHVLSFVLK